jgi:hypothetical protein
VRIVRFSLYIEDGEVGSKEYIELCDKRLLYKSSSIKQYEVAREVFRENKAYGDEKPCCDDTLTLNFRSWDYGCGQSLEWF